MFQHSCDIFFKEIYNEAVYDLLNSPSKNGRGLKVREHPKKGFYGELSDILLSKKLTSTHDVIVIYLQLRVSRASWWPTIRKLNVLSDKGLLIGPLLLPTWTYG